MSVPARERLLLLPDFVGHPICFQPVIAALEARFDVRVANYHDHYPYVDVPALAGAVRAALGDWRPDHVAGYSFGGLVGLELAGAWPLASALTMIDTHRLADPGPACEDWIRQRLAHILPPRLAELVDALGALGELDPRCVRHNLALFTAHVPCGRARAIHLLRCTQSDFDDAFDATWSRHADDVRTTAIATTHAGALQLPQTLALLLNPLAPTSLSQ